MSIQPLTHTTKTGELYYRREQVLRQIESLVDASEKELLTRARIEDLRSIFQMPIIFKCANKGSHAETVLVEYRNREARMMREEEVEVQDLRTTICS